MDCPVCVDERPVPGITVVSMMADDEVETGVWCPVCFLPSGERIVMREVCRHGWPQEDGVSVVSAWCDDCGSPIGASPNADRHR